MVVLPLKCIWMPKLLQVFLNFCVWYHNGNVLVAGSFVVGVVVLVPSGCLCIVVVVFVVKLGV